MPTLPTLDRRHLMIGAGAAGLAACAPVASPGSTAPATLPPLFDDIERRTFAFFWETGNPVNGLVPDRWPTPSFSSIAAVGFALTAYPIGVSRGFITRAQAAGRTLATLRFFDTAPMGEAETGVSGNRGFFYHFLDMQTGLRFRDCELSSVDTALLHLGVLFAGAWFDGDSPEEREIRTLAERIVARAEWPWFQASLSAISMGWHPGEGFLERAWTGYNEGMMVWLLALGSAGHPVGNGGWQVWTSTYTGFWRGEGATRRLAFAPLFGHQYSHMWVDFRGIQDAPMRAAGLDYFENSRRATWANRAYAIRNPLGWSGYSADVWGLTACDGPANRRIGDRVYYAYSARGPEDEPDGRDDGTIAPTAALGSLAFAPEIVIPAAEALHRIHGDRIYGQYGFIDAFNPSYRPADGRAATGRIDPDWGWIAPDYLGIDQGPILGAIANHRDGFVWRTMRTSAVIRRGLERAGFTGGWLA